MKQNTTKQKHYFLLYTTQQTVLLQKYTTYINHSIRSMLLSNRESSLLSLLLLLALMNSNNAFIIHSSLSSSTKSSYLFSTPDYEDGPSDYDPIDIITNNPTQKQLSVDTNENDAIIRDELKRELLLIGSISNRGQYTSIDEKNIVIDLVNQLEALNPTPDPSSECVGDWDLCLCSTQAFRSSPFFQSIRAIFGNDNTGGGADSSNTNKGGVTMVENVFDLHDKATSVGRVGRVRQSILSDGSFISEVDLEVGLMGGMPFNVKGTVVTTASYQVTGPESWDLIVKSTQVKNSNVPFLDQFLDDYPVEVPVGDIYQSIRGNVPVAKLKTYYVDEAMRITRDQDDNFYVFCRA